MVVVVVVLVDSLTDLPSVMITGNSYGSTIVSSTAIPSPNVFPIISDGLKIGFAKTEKGSLLFFLIFYY